MSKLMDVFISGSMENLVFYRRMGKNCVRTKRNNIKQTQATKKRGINFGIAARAGRGLRSGLQQVMPRPTDRSMQSRISGAISKWLGQSDIDSLQPTIEVPFVANLAFVEDKGFYSRFKPPLQINQTQGDLIKVKTGAFIPSKEIGAPPKTVVVKMILSVSGCLLPRGEHTSHETHSIDIPYTDREVPGLEFDFRVSMPPNSLTVIAGRLICYRQTGSQLSEIENPAYTAAGMIDARYRG